MTIREKAYNCYEIIQPFRASRGHYRSEIRMRLFYRLTVLAASASLLAACAAPPAPTAKNQSTTELNDLRADQKLLTQRIERLQDGVSRLEEQLQKQQSALVELQREMETRTVTPARESTVITAPQTTQPSSVSPSRAVPAHNLSASEIYLQAFSDHASQRYPEAIQGFELFLANFPTNSYAGNAQYWLGECYFALGKYDRAAMELAKTYDQYPDSAKTPEALARLAEALKQLNQDGRAEQVMQTLRSRYPNSEAAKKSLR